MAIDLPTELLLIFLSIVTVILCIKSLSKFKVHQIMNPVVLFLILHVFWIFFSSLFAQDALTSWKFLAAKLWYIIPFFLLPTMLLSVEKEDYDRLFKFFLLGMISAGSFVFYHHFQEGLSFNARTNIGSPIFRNHVNYACVLCIALPIVWYLYRQSRNWKWVYVLAGGILLTFLYFTYARVAYVAVFAGLLGYTIIRVKMLRLFGIGSVFILITGVFWLIGNNKYLDFAPDYEQAISHYKFDRLLTATYKGEDVSSMERIYRWVAGLHMAKEKPITGFGPGGFYQSYESYTVNSFKTYVSDNPDKSGIHNYYLMLMVEQGVVGLIIFILLIYSVLDRAQRVYHNLDKGRNRDLISMAIMIVFIICAINLINDMFEVIKVGSFFFLACHIVTKEDSK